MAAILAGRFLTCRTCRLSMRSTTTRCLPRPTLAKWPARVWWGKLRKLGEDNPSRVAKAWGCTLTELDSFYGHDPHPQQGERTVGQTDGRAVQRSVRRPQEANTHVMVRCKLVEPQAKKARMFSIVLCSACLMQKPRGDCKGRKQKAKERAKKWWRTLREDGSNNPTKIAKTCGTSRAVLDKWFGFRR